MDVFILFVFFTTRLALFLCQRFVLCRYVIIIIIMDVILFYSYSLTCIDLHRRQFDFRFSKKRVVSADNS